MQLHVAIISIYKKLTNKMLTGWQASWKLYVEMILPSGTEEYFNKKKTLNTKCWGVRAIALRPLTVLKNYSSCIITHIPHFILYYKRLQENIYLIK